MAQAPLHTSGKTSDKDKQMQALKQYGGYIITAILVALIAYFGVTYWQAHYARVDTKAADAYADIQQLNDKINLTKQNPDLDATAKQNLLAEQDKLNKDVDTLVAGHGDSIYAWQALLIQARQQADANQYDKASDSLKQALAIDLNDAGLTAITRLRYAQTLVAANQFNAALETLNHDMPNPFEASKQELLGDIYAKQNKPEQAIQSYENAWGLLSNRQEKRAILAIKLESLGVVPPAIKESPALIGMPALAQAQTIQTEPNDVEASEISNKENSSN